jgi:hypothetical protein
MGKGATVPLFYQKRVPEVLIQNEELSDEFYHILEEEELDDSQQARLEKKFAREIEMIKRDDRLETIAKEIVYHFPRRVIWARAWLSRWISLPRSRCTTRCSGFGKKRLRTWSARPGNPGATWKSTG